MEKELLGLSVRLVPNQERKELTVRRVPLARILRRRNATVSKTLTTSLDYRDKPYSYFLEHLGVEQSLQIYFVAHCLKTRLPGQSRQSAKKDALLYWQEAKNAVEESDNI